MTARGAMMTERFDISVNTPAGQVTTSVEVPTGFVPITEIVPLMRNLGEAAQALERRCAESAGRSISCTQGCAACCRMLVPLSPPEAFALKEYVSGLPIDRQTTITERLEEVRRRLEHRELWQALNAVAESTEPLGDEALDPINRAYYALRIPCPFLEHESCTIYEQRPSACRELLVTSPAELCRDLENNPVVPLPVPMRMGSMLGLLWAGLTNQSPRLIPLPLALEWADRHAAENSPRWRGTELLDQALDKIWRCLSQVMQGARGTEKG